jgi:hypothetical protein
MKNLYKCLILSLLALIWQINITTAVIAAGSGLLVSPQSNNVDLDEEFTVAITINSPDTAINAAEGVINFDKNKLEAIGVSKKDSVFRYWTIEPSFSNQNGIISFAGGLTTPGYQASGGILFAITFRAIGSGNAQLIFSSGAMLANDSKGSNVLTSLSNASISIMRRQNEIMGSSGQASPTLSGSTTTPSTSNRQASNLKKLSELLVNSVYLSSPTHPDQNTWYVNANVEMDWTVPADIEAVSYLIDHDPTTQPPKKPSEFGSDETYENLKEGIWYFHLIAKNKKDWSEPLHYRIMIDKTPPQPFEVTVEQPDPTDWPILKFKTSDNSSGIAKYEARIGSLEEHGLDIGPARAEFKVSMLEVGEHTALVGAIDLAGNETFSIVKFKIDPIPTPEIMEYTEEIRPNGKFFISGTSIKDVEINLHIDGDNGRALMLPAKSDQEGRWFIAKELSLDLGRYNIYAQAVNKNGISSLPSKSLSLTISPPIFARFGDMLINYFTVFLILLAIIILSVVLSYLLFRTYRSRIRKEALDIENVLHKNLESLKVKVDKEILELSRSLGKAGAVREKIKTRVRLKHSIDAVKRGVMKEIKDVERL